MAAARHDIVIDQGTDYALQLVVKEDNVVKDLTGYSARADLRATKESASPEASFVCTFPDAAQGEIKVALTNSDTAVIPAGIYFYDVEIYLGSEGSETFVQRLIKGKATVTREVTR